MLDFVVENCRIQLTIACTLHIVSVTGQVRLLLLTCLLIGVVQPHAFHTRTCLSRDLHYVGNMYMYVLDIT